MLSCSLPESARNSTNIRARVAEKLFWLGVVFDPRANAERKSLISQLESRVGLYVVPTDEELMIARHTLSLLKTRGISVSPIG